MKKVPIEGSKEVLIEFLKTEVIENVETIFESEEDRYKEKEDDNKEDEGLLVQVKIDFIRD